MNSKVLKSAFKSLKWYEWAMFALMIIQHIHSLHDTEKPYAKRKMCLSNRQEIIPRQRTHPCNYENNLFTFR